MENISREKFLKKHNIRLKYFSNTSFLSLNSEKMDAKKQ